MTVKVRNVVVSYLDQNVPVGFFVNVNIMSNRTNLMHAKLLIYTLN